MATSIVTVANQKGGVGKTTTVINLASVYASIGKRVLVIDLDSQANLTEGIGMLEAVRDSKKDIAYAIRNRLLIDDVVLSTGFENIDLIGGSRELDTLLPTLIGTTRQHKLIDQIFEIESIEKYEIVLIDTHPSLDIYFQAAMAASHYFLIPLFAESYSASGLVEQIRAVEEVRRDLNPMLTSLGAVITKFNRKNSTHVRFERIIRKIGKECRFKVLNTMIPSSEAVAGAESNFLPLNKYNNALPISQAYAALAGEILPELKGKRMGRRYAPIDVEKLVSADDLELAVEL